MKQCNGNTLTNTSQKQPPEVLNKKGIIRNFAKLAGKHLCQSLSKKRL